MLDYAIIAINNATSPNANPLKMYINTDIADTNAKTMARPEIIIPIIARARGNILLLPRLLFLITSTIVIIPSTSARKPKMKPGNINKDRTIAATEEEILTILERSPVGKTF